MDQELFSDANESKSAFVKFGKVGDYVQGTLVDIREIKSSFPGKENELVKIYEFLASGGEFHEMDDNKNPIDPPVKIEPNVYWLVGGRPGIDNQMRNAKIGQVIGMKFTDTKPPKTKGFSATKIIKVYLGKMDESFSGMTPATEE